MKDNKKTKGSSNGNRNGTTKDIDWTLSTWNVSTLMRSGAAKELVRELDSYKSDITAIQEIRWKGNGIRYLSSNNNKADIYYSGTEQADGLYGCGFIVRNKFRKSVMEWKPINERMCYLRIRGCFYNYSIICVYAPHLKRPDPEKDQFYDQLDRLVGSCPKYDAVVILGDFNAKIGSEGGCKGTIGKNSLHRESNDNGTRLTDFALSRGLVVSSTRFPHKRIHLGTWKIPGSNRANQIDHILIDARHASCILDVRSYRGANIDSDHYLVKAKVRSRISTVRTTSRVDQKINIEALKQPNVANAFADTISLTKNSPDADE